MLQCIHLSITIYTLYSCMNVFILVKGLFFFTFIEVAIYLRLWRQCFFKTLTPRAIWECYNGFMRTPFYCRCALYSIYWYKMYREINRIFYSELGLPFHAVIIPYSFHWIVFALDKGREVTVGHNEIFLKFTVPITKMCDQVFKSVNLSYITSMYICEIIPDQMSIQFIYIVSTQRHQNPLFLQS